MLGMLGLKKFLPGKLEAKQIWNQNILIDFLAKKDHSKIRFLLHRGWGGGRSGTSMGLSKTFFRVQKIT